MHWVFPQTTSVTSHQRREVLPVPFPAWFGCSRRLIGAEVEALQAWQHCALLAARPLPDGHNIFSLGLVITEFSIPVGYSPLSHVCLIFPVFSSVSQVRLDWLWWSSLYVGDPITWSRPVSLILCVIASSTVLLLGCLPHHLTPRRSSPSAKLGWGMCCARPCLQNAYGSTLKNFDRKRWIDFIPQFFKS